MVTVEEMEVESGPVEVCCIISVFSDFEYILKDDVPEFKGTLTLKNSKVKVVIFYIFWLKFYLKGRLEDCRGQRYGEDPLYINKARGIIYVCL